MACSLPHTDSEIETLVQKLIAEDTGRQNAILNLALQFENSFTAKDDLRRAYEKCTHISQESRSLIDGFLKEGSHKDYELNLSMYRKAAKLEKSKDAKLAWLSDKYYCRSQEGVGSSSSHYKYPHISSLYHHIQNTFQKLTMSETNPTNPSTPEKPTDAIANQSNPSASKKPTDASSSHDSVTRLNARMLEIQALTDEEYKELIFQQDQEAFKEAEEEEAREKQWEKEQAEKHERERLEYIENFGGHYMSDSEGYVTD